MLTALIIVQEHFLIVIKDIIGREGKGAIFFLKNIKNAQKYTKIRDFFLLFLKRTLSCVLLWHTWKAYNMPLSQFWFFPIWIHSYDREKHFCLKTFFVINYFRFSLIFLWKNCNPEDSSGQQSQYKESLCLLLTAKSQVATSYHLIDLGKMKVWVDSGATQWLWARNP